MGAAVYSLPFGRTANAPSWVKPVQAVFAFFAPSQISSHAIPNGLAHGEATHQSLISPSICKFDKPRCLVKGGPANSDLPGVGNLSEARTGRSSCLKILREFEPGRCRSSTGRLVISGRMADVCAALDRMANQNTSLH